MRASQLLRQRAVALVFLFLAACGGSGNDDASIAANAPPTASATYAASVPATAVVTLDGSASNATSGGRLTYNWALTGVPDGSTATITNPTAVQATLATDAVGTYTVTLTVSDGFKSQVASFTLVTVAPTPTILSDLVEPVSGAVQLSLSTAQGSNTVSWTVDGRTIGSGAAVTWDTTSFADGNHVVVAQIQSVAKYTLTATRTFQVAQSPVRFTSATITETAGLFIATVGAQSANGIQHVDGTLDGMALGSLGTPNACVGDPSGAACATTGSNGYMFRGTLGSGQHTVVVTATDGVGRALGTQLRLTVTDVP